MIALLAQAAGMGGYSFTQWCIAIVVILAAIGLLIVAIKAFEIPIPQKLITAAIGVVVIIIIAAMVIFGIKFIAGMG